jgi:hypothetical protein
VNLLGYQPTRRRLLKALITTAVGAPILVRLGRVVDKRPRLIKPEELPPIPWIGHC